MDDKSTLYSLIEAAMAQTEEFSVEESMRWLESDDTVFVDVRESHERNEQGYIIGSIHISRGFLEFSIDPEGPKHHPVFQRTGLRFVFYCAAGPRSALAAKTAQHMGLNRAGYIKGGLAEWIKVGAPVDKI